MTDAAKAVAKVLSFALQMDVSKKVAVVGGGNEYQKVGEIKLPLPLLSDFGIASATLKKKEGTDEMFIGEDGLPVYEDEYLDWLFSAAVAAAKAQARNMLVSGTAELKEGKKIAETLDELIAEGERRGNAEALKLAKEIQTSFSAFVQTLGKTAATQAVLVGLFRNREALSLQDDVNKGKFKAYLEQYAETLEEKDLERYGKYLTKVEEACKPGTPSDF